MTKQFLLGAAALALACAGGVGPSPLYHNYFLSAVDGDPLPVPYSEDGSELISGSLGFGPGGRPRAPGPATGTVNYTLIVRQADGTQQHSTVQLDYAVSNGELRINLCPPLALCIVSTELVGPILGPTEELVLTHHLAGNPGSVYRYFPTLPD